MLLTDLFGHPIVTPQPGTSPVRRRPVSPETKRAKLIRHLESSANRVLFDELFELLKAPLLQQFSIPEEFASDIGDVAVQEETQADEETSKSLSTVIPYEAWDKPWIQDDKDLKWSKEGLIFTQVRLFWRSFEELSLNNNEQEKWSVLRWIFRPAIKKLYMYDKRIGKSLCLPVHERDETFSFHNCCIAARMDGDVIREGVRRNISVEVIKAVEKVCSYD